MSSFSKPIVNKASSLTVKEESIGLLDYNSPNVSDIQKVHKNDSIISQILDKIFGKEALDFNENIINDNDNTNKDSDKENVDNRKAIENSERSTLKYKDTTNKNEDSQTFLTENDLIKNNLQNFDGISTHIVYKDSAEHVNTTLNVIDVEEDASTLMDTNMDIKNNIDSKSANEDTETTENQIEVQSEDTPDDSIKKVKFSNLNIGNNL